MKHTAHSGAACGGVFTPAVAPSLLATLERAGRHALAALQSITPRRAADHIDDATLRDLGPLYRDVRMQQAARERGNRSASQAGWF